MLEQIAGAQASLESDIELLRHAAAMGGDSAALAVAQNQLSRLGGLQQRIDHLPNGALTAIRAEVAASVAASQTLAQQVRTSVAIARAAEVALHAASAEAHRVTGDFVRDFYERKIFDPYLRFASPEDERAYREREEASHRAIEQARAEGTPEGELRALQLARAQLLDAGAHGATNSPDYAPLMDRISSVESRLQGAIVRTHPDRSATSARASEPDPLDSIAASTTVPGDLIANIRAAGITLADQAGTGHGVSTQQPQSVGLVRV